MVAVVVVVLLLLVAVVVAAQECLIVSCLKYVKNLLQLKVQARDSCLQQLLFSSLALSKWRSVFKESNAALKAL
jgi:hypothetical protein